MTDNEIAVGIDVSGTRIAVACYSHPGKIKTTCIQRLTAGRQYHLIRECLRQVREEIGDPQAVGIEQPYFGFPKAAYMHGMVVARTEDACRAVWPHTPQRFYQPSEWRKAAGMSGRATKDEVREFVTKQFGFAPANQDEADAAAISVAMWVEAFGE